MTLQQLNPKDIFKFTDSDTSYSLESLDPEKVTIMSLHGDRPITIDKDGGYSQFFDAEIELISKYTKNEISL